jgi:hypothetical protein
MSTKKIKYEKPVVMDLGVTEGMGSCSNGTLIVSPSCSKGSSPTSSRSCRSGSAALLGCTNGAIPLNCADGAIASLSPR